MNNRQHIRAAIAAILVATTAGLAGCGSKAPGATTGETGFDGPQIQPIQQGQIFAANGLRQIVVKTKGHADATASGAKLVRHDAQLGVSILGVPANGDYAAALAELRNNPNVQYAEPNFVRRMILPQADLAEKKPSKPTYPSVTPPNDAKFGEQYAPQIVRAAEAWTKTKGAGITIAIVDTGVDTSHPDLKDKIVPGHAVEDSSPTLNPPEKDDNGHGTHCAGIAAAITNNGTGIAGIAPDAKIMPVKVLSGEGSGSDAGVAAGIVWAADHGAQVISLSLGGPGESQVLTDAVKHALGKGAAMAVAMGNDGNGEMSYPAATPGVIAIGATDKADKKASFSQYGKWISVSAPGVDIMSTFPTYKVDLNKYGFPMNYASLDGTSMATPAAAGVLALIRAKFPALSPADVKKKIEASSDDKGTKGFDIYFGAGRVNAFKAVS